MMGDESGRKKRQRQPIVGLDGVTNVALEDYNAEERAFYRAQPRDSKVKIAATEALMKDMQDSHIPLRFKVIMSDIDDNVKAKAVRKLDYLMSCDRTGSEYYKAMAWVDALCKLPVGKFRTLPVSPATANKEEIKNFLHDLRYRLDNEVYGHADAKGHIERLIAQWVTNPKAKGMVIGIHGHMGTGKTSLCKAICKVLGLPFAFIPLGGASDGCFLDGHSYTYEGAIWGKIADSLMRCKCMNPVIFFDELDKVSESRKGQDIINLLIHITDSTQNDRFNDKYFADVDLDLSHCLIVFSYNDESRINPILRDRLTRVHTSGYSFKDKAAITRSHLLPEILTEYAMPDNHVQISDSTLRHIVELIEPEQGVRNLKRALVDVVSNINLKTLLGQIEPTPTQITIEHADQYIVTSRRDQLTTNISAKMMYL